MHSQPTKLAKRQLLFIIGAMPQRSRVGREAAAVAAVALAALLGAALFASQVDSPTALEACTPCTSGPDCSAGCRTGELRSRARMQQLAAAQAAAPQSAAGAGADAVHASLHDQQAAIERRNQALLQLNAGAHTEGLSSVLDAAVKQVLRAEAAEVKLRRQAELSKGASVESVYKSLRYAPRRARVGVGCQPAVRASLLSLGSRPERRSDLVWQRR